MNKTKRKHLSEFAVNLYSARWIMTPSSQLTSGGQMPPDEQIIADNCHIYLICKMPCLSFAKETFTYENGKIKGHIIYSIEGEKRLHAFLHDFPLLDGAVSVELSAYPHREIRTIDHRGEIVRYLPAHALCMALGMHINNQELNSLEVMYVGQAYGDGSRSAFDRLKSHSTLQKILADSHYNDPESEVFVISFEYLPYRIIHQMTGMIKCQENDNNDSERFFSILDNHLTEHQQICLVEAALIRYFQPKYNAIYKDNFPKQNHKILQECYELDFSALIVEINTDELCFSLFSEKTQLKSHHICNFDLVNHEDRWGFFHLPVGENKVSKMSNVIVGS